MTVRSAAQAEGEGGFLIQRRKVTPTGIAGCGFGERGQRGGYKEHKSLELRGTWHWVAEKGQEH
jgi:hypothetical protein